MDFGRALGVSFATGNNRPLKEGEVDETERVEWVHALIGLAILILTMAVLIYWRSGASIELSQMGRLATVAFVPLIAPFLVFWVAALLTRTIGRLPAAFLYLAITLAVVQLVTTVLASFGQGQSGFVLGLFLAVTFLAARGFLKVGWGLAILVSVLAVAGLLGTTFLLLMVPGEPVA